MMDLRQIDAKQLRVLLTLLEECSVTRAAQLLDQSQPYVSLVLRRLREATGDQILVRSGSKLVLTERGRGMIAPTRAALASIEQIVSEPSTFDPSTEQGTFRIASADCIETLVLPRLVEKLRDAAPRARVLVQPVERAFDYADALERDELDVLISNWPGAPEAPEDRTSAAPRECRVHVFAPPPVRLKRGDHHRGLSGGGARRARRAVQGRSRPHRQPAGPSRPAARYPGDGTGVQPDPLYPDVVEPRVYEQPSLCRAFLLAAAAGHAAGAFPVWP